MSGSSVRDEGPCDDLYDSDGYPFVPLFGVYNLE